MPEQSIIEINATLNPYFAEEHVRQMQGFMQHGDVSTYQHCLNVAYVSYNVAKWLKKFGIKVDIVTLMTGAFLHDFYLYDWHTGRMRKEGIHGFSHPIVAMHNAEKYFDLDNKVLNIIESHMFPLTITHVPKSKEAIIVCFVDKYCAIREMMHKKVC